MQCQPEEYSEGSRDERDGKDWSSVYVKGGEGRGFRERRERVPGGADGVAAPTRPESEDLSWREEKWKTWENRGSPRRSK